MRRFFLLLVAVLPPLLAACSTTSRQTPPPQAVSIEATSPTPPPAVELTPGLLYQLLVAEFSGQRGALRLSAGTYLDAAKRTGDYRLARRATRIAIYARDNRTALEAARLWVELEPDSDESHQSAAALLIAAGQTELARPHLERLRQSEQQDSNHGYQLVATLLASDPDRERALATMAELVASEPANPHALYAQAQLASELEQDKQALQVLEKLLTLAPQHEKGLILQARVLHSLGNQEGALQSMERALALSPRNHQLRLTYARMLIDARKLKQARTQFTLISQSTPNDPDVIYALGLLALDAGDLDAAEEQFGKLLRLEQREEESRFAMGQIAEAREQYDKAIEWFSSIAQGDRYLDAQLQAARIIAQQQGVEQARHYLHELETQNDQERVHLLLAEAQLLKDAGHNEEALAVYDEGLAQYTDNEELLYARGITAEKLGRIDITERDFKRILTLKPNDAQTLNALGYTLVDRTERYQEGYEYIERAYRIKPDDVAILDSMGWALYRLGRLEEALQFLQRAAGRLQDAEIAAHLGEVLWQSGQREQARQVWQKALEFDPNHPVLKQTLQRFDQ